MPIVFITYSLAYVDRANFSFGAASGMAQDLQNQRQPLLPARRVLLLRLLPVPAPRRALRRASQRPSG
ncbi:MAG: hypothetical protein WDN49_21810 [Acetobacteraceae bacterium]